MKAKRRSQRPAKNELQRLEWRWPLLLWLIAMIQRSAFLLSNRDRAWPFTIFYEGDSETYFLFARALIRGELYDLGIPFHPPATAWFLAGAHLLLGAGAAAPTIPHQEVKLLAAALSSTTVALLYLLVRPYLGHGRALLAALLACFSFGLSVISIAPLSEGPYLLLLVVMLLIWTQRMRHPLEAPHAPTGGFVVAFVLGALGGLLALTRAEGIGLILAAVAIGAVPAAVELARSRQHGRRFGTWVVVAAGLVVVLVPWTVHNYRRLSQVNDAHVVSQERSLPTFVPLTMYGPLNLALANNDRADGRFSRDLLPRKGSQGSLDLRDPDHLEMLLNGDQVARAWIASNPSAFVSLVMKKWWLAAGGALRQGFGQRNFPGGLEGVRRPVDLFTCDSPAAIWFLAPLIIFGGACLFLEGGPARRWLWIVAGLTLLAAAVVGMFFGYARQGVLLLPFWFTLAASGLWLLGGVVYSRLPAALSRFLEACWRLLAISIVALMLAVQLAGIRADRNYKASGTTLPGSTKLNPDLNVRIELLP